MLKIQTDTTNMRATLKALKASAAIGTEMGVVAMACGVLRKAGTRSAMTMHMGTNRYARGWIKAHNSLLVGRPQLAEVGMHAIPLPKLRRSQLVKVAFESLERRAARISDEIDQLRAFRVQLRNQGRDVSKLRLNKEINRLEGLLITADSRLEDFYKYGKFDGVLVMFGKSTERRFAASNIERIFPREFGATARVLTVQGRTTVQFEHLEPHANIVESRRKMLATAMSDMRKEAGGFVGMGSKTAADAFFAQIKKGLAPGTRVVRSSGGAIVAKIGGR
jgi:hypothetical protein